MRWDRQRLDLVEDSTLPGMPGIRGLLRSVQVPEFPGLTLHEVVARSALNAVPRESGMPFAYTINPYRGCAHQCVYCTSGDTLVLMADGSQRRIAGLSVGDRIIGTEREGNCRRYVETEVLAHWSTVKPAYRVTLEDGTEIIASGDHRFLTRRGWKHVTGAMAGPNQRPYLTSNDELLGFGRSASTSEPCVEYRRPGRATGDVHRFRLALAFEEGLLRTQDDLRREGVATNWFPFTPATATRRAVAAIRTSAAASVARISTLIAWPVKPSAAWQRGFLAGNGEILTRIQESLDAFGFGAVLEGARPNGVSTVRVCGGLREHLRFIHLVGPAIRRNCLVAGTAIKSDARLRVVAVQPLGLDLPMYDITTGTGDFIANGVVSHNCFARRTHEWLELDGGRDFDTQIVVKTNLVEVLRRELARPSWQREHVALGTNTDPYQRAEGRYRLMPGVIQALAGSGTPFSILTKGTLARRDIPLLVAAARDVPLGLGVSMAIWDDELHSSLEPGVPSPRARLDLVRAYADAGLPCGVFLAPVLPGLTDGEEALDAALGAIAESGASGVTVIPLHLRPGAREWFFAWLERMHPGLVPRYRRLYGRGSYLPTEYRSWLAARVAPLLARHGLDRQAGGQARRVAEREGSGTSGVPGDEQAEFPAGSLPARRSEGPGEEQLALY